MSSAPVLLSPALPTELINYILDHHVHPTTLVICSTRADFLTALQEDIQKQNALTGRQSADQNEIPDATLDLSSPIPGNRTHTKQLHQEKEHNLLVQTLSDLAISRHIRTVYIPSVTHLRSYSSVFSSDDSRIPSPPPTFAAPGRKTAALVIYGAIELHRYTSEWSVQGLGSTMATFVETASRLGWQLVMIEPPPRKYAVDDYDDYDDYDDHDNEETTPSIDEFGKLLRADIPILSGSARRAGLESEGGWSSRSVEVGRVISRWLHLQRGPWAAEHDVKETEKVDEA